MFATTTLELDIILKMLSELAQSPGAKARCLGLSPEVEPSTVERMAGETGQARRIVECLGLPPLPLMIDLHKVVKILEMEALLSIDQIETMCAFFVAGRRMKQYLSNAESTGANIAYYGRSIEDLSHIEGEINRCIRAGMLDDRASDRLHTIRRAIENAGSQIKGRLEALLRKNKDWFSEGFVSIRNGRYTLPVKRAHKGEFPGVVVDLSGSGATCFIEPNSVGKLQDELNELYVEEGNEERRILYELTGYIVDAMGAIKQNIDVIETLDFLFAKGRLSLSMDARAVRLTHNREMRLLSARHPLIEKDRAVPLDFMLGDSVCGVVITGPNTGGKTVALKTIGLLVLMVQCGLHIPSSEQSSVCLFEHVCADIGDGQSISENLSTFSSHMLNVLTILKGATPSALVLLDELGSGTDPAEGMGIAVAILEKLLKIGCLFVATTHYPEVKAFADKTRGLINARMTFDRESLMPLYRLEIGEAGESCALYIAERLGMPEDMLISARAAAYGFAEERESAPRSASGIQAVVPLPPEEKEEAAVPRSKRFQIGDSVLVYPKRELGIVFQMADDTGNIGVQIQGKKVFINHKRLKIKVPASELYPEDYDFSIIFDSVENRKAERVMQKRHDPTRVIKIKD